MNQDLFLVFTIALLIGSLNAYLAKGRGRSPIIWFFVGAFFGLLGVLALFLFPKIQQDAFVLKEPAQKDLEIKSPLPPLASSWYYLNHAHVQVGPISLMELEKLYKEGAITSSTYLWCGGMPDWKKLEYMATLQSYLSNRAEEIKNP